MSLFQLGDFTLHSGEKSSFKIECDELTRRDWDCLAKLIVERAGLFRETIGIPDGGCELAERIRYHDTGKDEHPLLIVDDVYTTGASMREMRRMLPPLTPVIGWVAFARRPVQEPWIKALFTLSSDEH